MKTTFTVLFVIAMVIATTQTFRHVYVKWIEPGTSVLDEFKDKIDTEIKSAKGLKELTEMYRKAKERVKKYESNKSNPTIKSGDRYHKEPYKTERAIKSEIKNREHDNKQLFKLKFYWIAGLLSFLLGVFVFRKFNAWLDFSGIVAGFSEMLYWTSPLFHYRLLSKQFVALLNYKLAFSLITLIILITLWILADKKKIFEK